MDQSKTLQAGRRLIGIITCVLLVQLMFAQQEQRSVITGSVKDENGDPIEFATVYIKENRQGAQTDSEGRYRLEIAPGNYTFCVQLMGYEPYEQFLTVNPGEKKVFPVTMVETGYALEEVVVEAKSAVQRINESAFNAVALDATVQHNSTASLSGILNKVSGVRIRETGGVGSEMQVMMDGFSGKHIKVFIDGVPQDGVGRSFGLNNIPVNYAERIEVYKGVVPIEFGTDAIGGVINIVTKKNYKKQWHLDASYSYGSFNTHKSFVNFGQTFRNGLTYEINAFQNYSDNDYHVDTPVKEFLPDGGSSTDRTKIEHVRRFHDTYHNEAVTTKIGLVDKSWADRLIMGVTLSKVYKELQTGVRQEIVFGEKYRKGYSIMPSLEYRKRNLLIDGVDATLTVNYNNNVTQNVDTSLYEFNWKGEKRLRANMNAGEQSYMHLRSDNDNWNGTFSLRYRWKNIHSLSFNHIFNSSRRSNRSLLNIEAEEDPIPKVTEKNVSGLSYQIMPGENWNASVFGKYYHQLSEGPKATSSSMNDFVKVSKTVSVSGYGTAATWFFLPGLQAKVSYEKVYRLPSNNEMFGDEDLESGDIEIRPENSHNLNLNVSYDGSFGKHAIFADGGVIYRDIRDYIQRNITGLGGGKYGAAYINHGRVKTKGFTLTARYNFADRMAIGGNFTEINTRDNVKTTATGSPSNTYGSRMPNVPYLFANGDIAYYWRNFAGKGNQLVLTYDNFYVKSFPLYSEALGSSGKAVVPSQFSHNLAVSYSPRGGRYHFSVECQNITDEKLYDNYSLQKAGRAFYAKVRVSL